MNREERELSPRVCWLFVCSGRWVRTLHQSCQAENIIGLRITVSRNEFRRIFIVTDPREPVNRPDPDASSTSLMCVTSWALNNDCYLKYFSKTLYRGSVVGFTTIYERQALVSGINDYWDPSAGNGRTDQRKTNTSSAAVTIGIVI